MALVPFYAKWLGASLVALAAVWLLTRRVSSPVNRLALRCLATSAALTPQPLWVPGEGGAVMPAVSLLMFGRAPVFSYAMGAFPIVAVAILLFTFAGWRLARSASGFERLVHHAAWRWTLLGMVLPLVALAAMAPFLAYFLFGGPIAIWGTASLVVLGAATALDWRTSREPRWLNWAAYLLAVVLAAAAVWFYARRFTGVQ